MKTPLEIKGVREGLLITIPEGDWREVRPELLATIDERAEFFQGARIALEVDRSELRASELGSLRDELAERSVTLWAVLSSAPATQAAAADLGLAIQLSDLAADEEALEQPIESALSGEAAVLVERTVRSGNSIRHPGHVVVLGDVNPGAELVAGGHVIVWGRLRGVVHAGAEGNESATVCALDLAPTQLRIAGKIAVSPEKRGRPRPEIAHVREGQIVAESWDVDRRR
jgi:septum site-determining protein MinC